MAADARTVLNQLRAQQSGVNAKQLLEQLRQQQEPQADTSPFPIAEPPPRDTPSMGPPMANVAGMVPPALTDRYSQSDRAAAAAGVDVESGADIQSRALLGFAPNKAYELSFGDNLIKKAYGPNTPTRLGPQSNQVEFLNPKTKRWTTLDEASFTKADLKDWLGPGGVAATSMTGAIAGTKLGVPGIAIGSSAGAFLGEFSRLMYGKKRGVHDLSPDDITKEALKAAGMEALFSAGGAAVAKAGQLARRFMVPNALSEREARDILRELDEALPDVNAIREGGGAGFNPTVPQILKDPELAGEMEIGASLERSRRRDLIARDAQNDSALEAYFDSRFKPRADASNVGAMLQGQMEMNKAAFTARTERSVETAENLARRQVESLPLYDDGDLGDRARKIAQQYESQIDSAKKLAWDAYEQSIGLDKKSFSSKYQVPISKEAAAVIEAMSNEQKKSIFRFEEAHLGQLLPEALTGGKPMDAAVLDKAIKSLRKRIRQASKPGYGIDADTGQMMRLESALSDMRNGFLQTVDPVAFGRLQAAEAQSLRLAQLRTKSSLSQMLRRDGDYYHLTNPQVFREIFLNKDALAMRELYQIADPAQRLELVRGMWSIYRSNFTQAGIPKPSLHEKFLQQYGDVAKEMFSPDDWAEISKFGSLGKGLEEQAKQVASYMKTLRGGLHRKITDSRPERIVQDLLDGKFSSRDIRLIRSAMEGAGYHNEAVAAFGGAIKNQITRDGKFSLSALQDVLKKRSGAIVDFAGDGYYRDLLKLAKGMERSQRITSKAAVKHDGPYWLLTRVWLRPLSREGLARTAAKAMHKQNADDVMYELMTSPTKLRQFVALGNRRADDRKVAAFLGSIGGSLLLDQED